MGLYPSISCLHDFSHHLGSVDSSTHLCSSRPVFKIHSFRCLKTCNQRSESHFYSETILVTCCCVKNSPEIQWIKITIPLFAISVNSNFKICPNCPFLSMSRMLTLIQIPITSHFKVEELSCWPPPSYLAPLNLFSILQLNEHCRSANQFIWLSHLNLVPSVILSMRST